MKKVPGEAVLDALTGNTPLNPSTFPSDLSETVTAFNEYLACSGPAAAYLAVPAAFLKSFRGVEGQVALLYGLGRHAYQLCLNSKTAAEECARLLLRLLTACITEKQERVGKRAGAYAMASLLLRCYFHLVRQTGLIGNVLRVMSTCDLPAPEAYPKAAVCTYKYYLARYAILKGQYAEAAESCEWVAERLLGSNFSASSNLKRVMRLLIPLKLVLQQRWPRQEHWPLLRAGWNGNLVQYRRLLSEHRQSLLREGTFIIYQRLQLLCLLRLLRHLQAMLNSTRIPLPLISTVSGEEVGALSCWLVELIAKGAVRGYLSEDPAYLVLSAQNPFPAGVSLV